MSTNATAYQPQDEIKTQELQLQRFFFRIIPYWPMLILSLILGYIGARIFLKYSVNIYEVRAKISVIDDSQQKNANLIEIMNLDTRNLLAETEREIQILYSRDLITSVVKKLQLNIQCKEIGTLRTVDVSTELPFWLTLENPDSIKSVLSGEVTLLQNEIKYLGVTYPVDSFVQSPFGKVKWVLKPQNKNHAGPFILSLYPTRYVVAQLRGGLMILPISKQSSILELVYRDPISLRGVEVLNTLIAQYGANTVEYKSRVSENTLRFLDERLNIVADDLSGVERKLQDYKTTAGITNLSIEGDLYLAQLKETDKKISEMDVQLEVLHQIESYVNKRNSSADPIPATLGITDPVLVNLLTQLYQSEFELEKTKQLSGEKNPQVEVYEDAISKLKPSITKSINNLKYNLQASKTQLQNDAHKMDATLGRIPLKERLLLDISRQQSIKNSIYTFLLQKREEAAITAASIVPNHRIIEKPEPGGIVAPNRPMIFALANALAMVLLCIFIYLVEFANNTVLFRSQLDQNLDIPIIGELVFQPNAESSPFVVGNNRRDFIAEQFRELRTNLSYVGATTTDKTKVYLFTSSIRAEGKSFVSLNTAASISLNG
ncbi:MAG: GumC family protein, partial [Ferruginibacter sp.]